MTITIKKKFKSLIRPLSTDEYEQLEQNLLDEGCRDPLVLWGDILLDGHHRYEICTKHGISYQTVQAPVYIRTDADAEDWIDKNQLGRRNLTKDEWRELIGRQYNRRKKRDGERGPQKLAQNEPVSTAEVIAAEHGVSAATVKRAGQFAEAVQEQREANPEADTATVYRLAREQTKTTPQAGRSDDAGKEEDSDNLFQLKLWWRKATKKDRKAFLAWIKTIELGRA